MNVLRRTAAIAGMLSIVAGAAIPASAHTLNQTRLEYDDAVVIPTPAEAQRRLGDVTREIRSAELASVSNPAAQADLLAARRAYSHGYYDEAMSDASKAESELGHAPNWNAIDVARK